MVPPSKISWRIGVTRSFWYSLGYRIRHGGRILHGKNPSHRINMPVQQRVGLERETRLNWRWCGRVGQGRPGRLGALLSGDAFSYGRYMGAQRTVRETWRRHIVELLDQTLERND